MNKDNKPVVGAILCTLTTIATTNLITYISGKNPIKHMPRDININSEFPRPSGLEIELHDLDGNGDNETIMKYNEKSYLLKLDSEGNPTIRQYNVEPSKIIEKLEDKQ